MRTWQNRIGGSVLMGIFWAVAWMPVAIVLGTMIIDPDNSMDEMWFAIGAIPGFLCGFVFSMMLGFAERQRRLDEVSLPRVTAWGAVSGLLVGALPWALGDQHLREGRPLWVLPFQVISSLIVIGAISAVVSTMIARSRHRELTDASAR